MSPIVCPTVTALDQTQYRRQVEEVQAFARRLHIDFMDGILAPTKSPPIQNAWWPKGIMADCHVMYKNPLKELETLVSLQPHLIIIHAEADGVKEFFRELDDLGIKRGIALLKDTPVDAIMDYLDDIDHVLIFSGELGHFGGTADLALLDKITLLKSKKSSLEIGWDGGIDEANILELVRGGVDVLNTGGYIHKSTDPEGAYDTLVRVLTEGK